MMKVTWRSSIGDAHKYVPDTEVMDFLGLLSQMPGVIDYSVTLDNDDSD